VDALDRREDAVTPTLIGRLQTRLALAAVVGLPIALLVAALLEGVTARGAVTALGVITLLGLAWEGIYHLIQQRRWDRDWPISLALAAGVPEALVAWPVLKAVGAAPATLTAYLALFLAVWVGLWVAQQGPISIFLPHWRHHGARLTAERPIRAAAASASAPAHASHTQPAAASSGVGWLSLTPQRLVSAAVFASVIVAVIVLAPMVGRDGSKDATASSAEPATQPTRINPGIVKARWDTADRIDPAYVEFKGAGIASPLARVKLNKNGALATPKQQAPAWYADGAAPGQRGPAVIIADSATVFARLGEAKAGQKLRVVRVDASQISYQVDSIATVDASAFPSQKVYGQTVKPVLRLIGYDRANGRNVIVYAHAISMTTPPTRG
jgi:hypothetical protein